tara:strand:- start:603 stop:1175 length:573 start_codon:yes stop_codon:yes gene_type:complete
VSQRRSEVTMQQLFFSQLDERKAVAFLQRWPQKRFRDGVNTWGNTEWQVFGCKSQLEFSAQSLPDGVRITYYLSEEARRKQGLAGLTPDGSFELRVDMQARWLGVVPAGPAIVTSREAGRESKAAYERILWQRLVLDFTKLGARELGDARQQTQKRPPCSATARQPGLLGRTRRVRGCSTYSRGELLGFP